MSTHLGSRRDFMRLGVGGAAVVGSAAVGGTLLAGAVGAATTQAPGGPGSTDSLSSADEATVLYLEGVELAAAAVLEQAIDRRVLQAGATETCRSFAQHHEGHGRTLAALAGGSTGELASPNAAVLAQVGPQVAAAADAQALLDLLADFAERVAATSQAAMAALEGLTAASVVNRISPIDAQQAAVMGQIAGRPMADWLPIAQPTAGAFEPSSHPA